MRKFSIFIFLWAFPMIFIAQESFLKLRSGNYTVPTQKNYTSTGNLPSTAFFDGSYTFIGHFNDAVSQSDRAKLDKQGITFLSYLPDASYVLRIEATAKLELLNQVGMYSISSFEPRFKMQHELAAGTTPEYAQVGSKSAVNFSVLKGVNVQRAMQATQAKGIAATPIMHFNRVLSAIVSQQQLQDLAGLPFVEYIEPIDPPSEPENLVGTTSHRSSFISNEFVNPVPYNGAGVWVALGDDGSIGPHIDYTGRTDQSTAGPDGGNHGDHIAGTIMGAGNLDPTTRGMAWAADIQVYDVWDAVNSTPTSYNNPGVVVTSTSYSNGCNAGYTNFARSMDEQITMMPNLMHVFSAGNSGTSDCGYGAGNEWGNVTGGVKVAKNVIAVGNLTDQDQLANSSSRGPAEDGRIKPELCGVGTNVYSTNAGNIYNSSTGTSMSAPGVSGTYAQLVHAFRDLNNGTTPKSALIKNALMNTADDLGNAGPDFKFGFGRINARKALNVLANNYYASGTVANNQTVNQTITIPANATELRVMVYWNDVEASANASPALVNDINMTVSTPQGGTLQPLVLDPTPNVAALDAPAVPGIDNLNNMEQVVINQPAAGNYTVNLDGFNIPFGPQEYFITYYYETPNITLIYPRGGESLVPGEAELIRWDATGVTSGFTIELSTDNGNSWSNLGTTAVNDFTYSWTPGNTVTGDAIIRVTSGAISDQSDNGFNIIGVPSQLSITYVCPDSLGLAWNAVNGATAYEVFRLGNEYMDPIDTVTGTTATVVGVNPAEVDWFSVRALDTDVFGRRAIAIEKPLGTVNCVLTNDLSLEETITPSSSGPLNLCSDLSALAIEVRVKNYGATAVTSFDAVYSLNGATPVSETISANLQPGDDTVFTFNSTVNLNATGNVSLLTWVELNGDQNSFNDTSQVGFAILNGGNVVQLPVYQDFESFNACATDNNCEATVCSMPNDWFNAFNGLIDDIDWRVNSGATPSNGTGPLFDFDPGDQSGNYIYLEASGGCEFQEAQLITPCIDLTSAQAPELNFGYNMNGGDMGNLHIDVLVNGQWINNIIPPISEDNNISWSTASANLSQYIGNIINVRFRGVTGPGWRSDMALDGISIAETTQIPDVDFTASDFSICVGQSIDLIDLSTGAPGNLTWNITPNSGFSYVNGTNANSFQPEIQFNQAGFYDVELIGSNPNGSDTLMQTSFIEVTNGGVLPILEDFEATIFPPSTAWFIENPDGGITWMQDLSVTGINGTSTGAAYIDNYSYNAPGELDILELPILDLSNVNNAYLTFDIAAAQYQNSSDGLRIEASTDCGETFTTEIYFKEGSNLATVSPVGNFFTPSSGNEWRRDTVSLAPFLGQSVNLRFVAINDYGNTLYLDNINLVDASEPVAQIGSNDNACINQTVVFQDNSQGVNLTHQWNFGQDATPATATGAGPHSVVYSSVGTKQVSLAISDGSLSDNSTKAVQVDDTPQAGFNYQVNGGTTVEFFSNQGGTSSWDFGDGSPVVSGDTVAHNYVNKGIYQVTHYLTNGCGSDSTVVSVTAAPTGLDELDWNVISIYPNPTRGLVTLEFDRIADYTVTFRDLSGRVVQTTLISDSGKEKKFDISNLAQGTYFVSVLSSVGTEKVFKVNVIE